VERKKKKAQVLVRIKRKRKNTYIMRVGERQSGVCCPKSQKKEFNVAYQGDKQKKKGISGKKGGNLRDYSRTSGRE